MIDEKHNNRVKNKQPGSKKEIEVSKESYEEIEVTEELYNRLQNESQYLKNDILEGDRIHTFVSFLIDNYFLIQENPIYELYKNLEEICVNLNILKEIKGMEFINEKQSIIKPNDRINKIKAIMDEKRYKIFDKTKTDNIKEDNKISGNKICRNSLNYIWVNLVTCLEIYLEKRLINTLLSNREVYIQFIRNIEKDLPTKWRSTRKKVTPSDYYLNMDKIVFDNLLFFPFHDISGRVNHVYKAAFGVDLMEYHNKSDILKFIQIRHKITHKQNFYEYYRDAEEINEEIIEMIPKILEFCFWIEDKLEDYPIIELEKREVRE